MMINKINRTTAACTLFGIAFILCICMGGGGEWYNCIVPIALALLGVIVSDKKEFNNSNIVFIAVMAIVAVIPVLFTLADKHNAIHELEKLICFAVAFVFGMGIKNEAVEKYIFFGTTVTAVFGLICYMGAFPGEEFVFDDRGILRLQSFFRYANTAAIMLGTGYLVSFKFYEKYPEKVIANVASCILLAMYLAVSKAAISMFIVAGTVLIGFKREYAGRFVIQNSICIAFAAMIIVFKSFTVIFMVAAIVACELIKFKPKHLFKIWISFLILAVIGVIAFAMYKDYNIFETLLKRFDYMKDSLALLKEHWLWGIGAGGWRYYQYSVQQSQYNTAYIHNGWLQMWIENGAAFFACFVILMVKTIASLVKNKSGVLCAVLVLVLVHSFIDIDFGFGAVLMLLGVITGSVLVNNRRIAAIKPVTVIVIAISCVSLTYMTAEYFVRLGFESSYLDDNNAQALSRVQLLEKLCPYDSELKISIAALNDEKRGEYIEKARTISPLDPDIAEAEIDYLVSCSYPGVIDKCVGYINMAPKQEKTYVKAKLIAETALDNGCCSPEEYGDFIRYAEERRIEEGVTDRNALLEKLWKERNQER